MFTADMADSFGVCTALAVCGVWVVQGGLAGLALALRRHEILPAQKFVLIYLSCVIR